MYYRNARVVVFVALEDFKKIQNNVTAKGLLARRPGNYIEVSVCVDRVALDDELNDMWGIVTIDPERVSD